ncbi:MAG: RsiV family protein [Prevotellaceae bacterium]|jgi:hypothetical protein|nr:RsiV family protein [Prevotellaceae bacterium]
MNKYFFYALAITVALFSCSNLQNSTNGKFAVDNIVVCDTLEYNNLTLYFEAQLPIFPSIKNEELLYSIYNHSFDFFGTSVSLSNFMPKSYSKEALNQSLLAWEELFFSDLKRDFIDIDEVVNYDYYVDIQSTFFNENLLSLVKTEDGYLGGAHGFLDIQHKNFDLKTNKEIHNTDIFKDITDTVFETLLVQYFNNEYAEDSLMSECLFDEFTEKIPLNDNFYFDKDKIYFIYNQYEITPYSCGVIEFSLPFDEITEYLKPEFLERLKEYFLK